MTLKDQLRQVADSLPEDATLEEAVDRLYLLYKIQKGIEQADAGQVVPHHEVEERMRARWGE